MLLTLVYQFEDNNRIIPSELSRLLPADFYGNRIEFNGERLFKPWSKQYGQYTQKIIELSKEYGESKEYLYEVDLDLKNFFPSVHPAVLENILIDNLPLSYDEDDRKTYKTVVRKLLVFRLDQKKALDQEEKEWYLNGKSYAHTELLFAKGIPQGLPHTYFFANLFMLRVKAIYEKVLPGKMLFYVDDSVIFTNGKSGTLSAESVNEAINQINYWLKKELSHIPENAFTKKLLGWHYDDDMFVISIHPLGTKSSFSPISEAIDHSGDAYLQGLCRETSAIGFDMHTAWTEQELKTLYKRTKTLRQVIEKEIENLSDDDAEIYKTELYRYRKFFANREFSLRFNIENKDRATELLNFFSKINQHSPNKPKMLEEFFIYFNENNLEMVFRSTFTSCVQEREDTLPEIDKQYRKLNTLLYGPHLSHSYLLKARASYNLENDSQIYTSLIRCTKHLSERYTTLPIDEKIRCIEKLAVKTQLQDDFVIIYDQFGLKTIFQCSGVVRANSNTMNRMLLNAVVSSILCYVIDDHFLLCKQTKEPVLYAEIRLLSVLRSRFWTPESFRTIFFSSMQEEYCCSIDYSLLQVLHIFHTFVSNPIYVDKLILTHKYCCDTWKNGTKQLFFYTLHNQEHAVELIKKTVQIIHMVSRIEIKGIECFLLFAACYLHDISLVSLPQYSNFYLKQEEEQKTDEIYDSLCRDLEKAKSKTRKKQMLLNTYRKMDVYFEKQVRNGHAANSAEDIRKFDELSFLDITEREWIAQISAAHGLELTDAYKIGQGNDRPLINLKTPCILLRLADLLDISRYRVSRLLLQHNIQNMDEEAAFHWISHLLTDNCVVDVEYIPQLCKKKSFLLSGQIIEKLIFTIDVYTNQTTPLSPSACKHVGQCKCYQNEDTGKPFITIDIEDGTNCRNHECPFLCKWFLLKNNYMLSELNGLKLHLKKGNYFEPQIQIRLCSAENIHLPNEMFDKLRTYVVQKKIGNQ